MSNPDEELLYFPDLTKRNEEFLNAEFVADGRRIVVNADCPIEERLLPKIDSIALKENLKKNRNLEVPSFGPTNPAMRVVDARTVKAANSMNLFAYTVHQCYYQHYPLHLKPDILWFTILQGLTLHLKENRKIAKKCFPDYERPSQVILNLDPGTSSTKKQTKHNLKYYINEMKNKIDKRLGKSLTMLSGVNDSRASIRTMSYRVALSGPLKLPFDYSVSSKGCGIPFIELEGTEEEWIVLEQRVRDMFNIKGIDLGWWEEALMPVIENFTKARKGEPNVFFFPSFCNLFSESGKNKPITGWLQSFFPYLRKSPIEDRTYRNPSIAGWRHCYENAVNSGRTDLLFGKVKANQEFLAECGDGVALENIPHSLSKVNFKLHSETEETGRRAWCFTSGIAYIIQHRKTRALQPVFGWAALYADK